MPNSSPQSSSREPHIDRQLLASLIPLTAVCIALAEFLFDHTQPRWAGPWFWIGLIATFGLLIVVQILRFGKSKPLPPAKPDYSATSIIRRNDPFDRGTR
jgi:peptidoglycan/LPS O-acetylase OafA/YrhL